MKVHPHSMLAFENLQTVLTERQKEVLEVYNKGDFTDHEVAKTLGWEINRVSGRVGELLKRKAIVEKKSIFQNGSTRRVCGLSNCTLF